MKKHEKKTKTEKAENIKQNKEIKEKSIEKKEQENTEKKQPGIFKNELFSEVIIKNPVLVSTIGLCPVVAICTSVKSAILLSVITYLTMILAQVLSASLFKFCPQWIRIALYTLSGMAVVAPSMLVLEKILPEDMIALGIYLPLLAVNPLITRQCERIAVKSTVKYAFINAISCATGYSAVLIITGIVRELFGNGTFWGYHIYSFPHASALTNPFGGFIILGFMAAILRWYFKKIDPEYAEELAVHSRSSIKKPRVKKPKDAPNLSTIYEKKENDILQKLDLNKDNEKSDEKNKQEKLSIDNKKDENSIGEQSSTNQSENQKTDENKEKTSENKVNKLQDEKSVNKKHIENKKIEYTPQELEELMSKNLEDVINSATNYHTEENSQESPSDKEEPKQ